MPDGSTTAVATVRVGTARVTPDPAKSPVTLPGGVAATWATPVGGSASSVLTWSVDGLTVTVSPLAADPGGDDAVVVAVAGAVLVGAPEPLPVPVSVATWPAAGWSLAGLISTYVTRDGVTGAAGRDVLLDLAVPGQEGTAVTIDSAGLAFTGSEAGTPEQIGGRTWTWDPTSTTYTWKGPDRFVRVSASGGGVGRDVLRQLVAALTPASSFGDETTWYDPTTAFPSG